MKTNLVATVAAIVGGIVVSLSGVRGAQEPPSPDQLVASLKQNFSPCDTWEPGRFAP